MYKLWFYQTEERRENVESEKNGNPTLSIDIALLCYVLSKEDGTIYFVFLSKIKLEPDYMLKKEVKGCFQEKVIKMLRKY